MNENPKYPAKYILVLRTAISCYLVYLAWSLRGAPGNNPQYPAWVFWGAIGVFAGVGLILGIRSILHIVRGEYDGSTTLLDMMYGPVDGDAEEASQDTEEQSSER